MMRDLNLRFEDEAAWIAHGIVADIDLAVDVIGIIRNPIQQWRDDGTQVFRAIPGWHVNIRCLDDRDLSGVDPFVVTPAEPARVWF